MCGGGGQRQSNREGKEGTTSRGGIEIGGPDDPGYLDSGDGQYSRHACCKYWCHLLTVQNPSEVPREHQAQKE